VLAWLAVALPVLAQKPPILPAPGGPLAALEAAGRATAGTGTNEALKTVEDRLAEARASLAAAEAGAAGPPAGIAAQDLSVRRALQHRLVRLYEQHLGAAAELEAARARKAEVAAEAQTWTRFSEPRPYSILLSDRLREQLQAARLKTASDEAALSLLDGLMEENRGILGQAEEKTRWLNEQIEGAKDPLAAARLSWERETERLRSQTAAAGLAILDSERQIRLEEQAGNNARLGLLRRQLAIAEAGAVFTQADLDQVSARIERERAGLERELAEAQGRREAALRALESARAEGRPPAPPRSQEVLSAREAQLAALDTAIRCLRLMLEGGNIERAMWEVRFASHDSRSVETLRESARRLETFTRRIKLWRDQARQEMAASAGQIRLQETRLDELAAGSDLRASAEERLTALRDRDQGLVRFVRSLERLQGLTERWAESLRASEARLPFLGRARNLFADTRSFLDGLWTFELFAVEDTITVDGQRISGRRSVTVGKVVLALLILVAGYWITGLVSRVAEPVIIRRFKIEPHQASLLRRWFRAVLVLGLLVFSLISVKIPLTVFAFAGGALAIGLGFGTQTLLKNLVSGIIILFERPFRVGDVLDVGGQRGTVTGVGFRASVLQLWDGTETLIPNSALLENNLTNWTYSNRRVRFAVTVGVAYGSDPRRVMQLLSEAAERHGLVEKDPRPQVFFSAFGESTLDFELRFWVDVSRANAAQVSSDLRLMIAGAFAEAGLTIAFPQRDLHLHAERPIPVALAPAASPQADAAAPAPPPKDRHPSA